MKKYKIKIRAQAFTFEDITEARRKVRSLLESEIWFLELSEEDDTSNDTENDIEEVIEEEKSEPEKKQKEVPGKPKRKRRTKAEMIAAGKQIKESGIRKPGTYLKYSDEVNEFIKENWQNNTDKELVVMIKEKFEIDRSIDQIKGHRRDNGWVADKPRRKVEQVEIKKKSSVMRYPEGMKDFIEENMDGTKNKELCVLINEEFDIEITMPKLAAFMQYKNIRRGGKMGPKKKWTDKIIQYLRDNVNNFSNKELCEELESQFNVQTSIVSLQVILSQKGIKRDYQSTVDPKIGDFIKKSKTKDVHILRDEIIEKFEVDVSIEKLRNLMSQEEGKLPGEEVDDEVKRVEEQRKEDMPDFIEEGEDVDFTEDLD